jgi:hypothetical protein
MALPPQQYVQVGPSAPSANSSSAVNAALAVGKIGEAISEVGDKLFRVAEAGRKATEGKQVSEFMLGLDRQAADFSNKLMSRNDPEKWSEDWDQKVSSFKESLDGIEMSPEGKSMMQERFSDWATRRSIAFGAQASARSVHDFKATAGNAMQYYVDRNEFEAAEDQFGVLAGSGVLSKPEIEEARRGLDRARAMKETDNLINEDPEFARDSIKKDDWIQRTPGATAVDQKRALSAAEAKIEELRQGEIDFVETALDNGTIRPHDLDASQYLTAKDKAKIQKAMITTDAPTNEQHAQAWQAMDDLRAARENPEISQEEYRRRFNEARTDALGFVPPQWQGDIKQELSYLSPAGRAPSGGSNSGINSSEDLKAVGRQVIFGARDSGLFGATDKDANEPAKAKAYLEAEKLRVEVNRYINTHPDASVDDVELYAAGLVSNKASSSTATKLPMLSIPGSGVPLRTRIFNQPTPRKKPSTEVQKADQNAPMPSESVPPNSDLLPPIKRLEERSK